MYVYRRYLTWYIDSDANIVYMIKVLYGCIVIWFTCFSELRSQYLFNNFTLIYPSKFNTSLLTLCRLSGRDDPPVERGRSKLRWLLFGRMLPRLPPLDDKRLFS